MLRKSFIILCLFLLPVSMYAQEDIDPWYTLPHAGWISDEGQREYRLTLNIGLEQWEGEKKSETRYFLWYMTCVHPQPSYTTPNPFDTYCHLERTIFTLWGKGHSDMPNTVSVKKGDTDDNTIQLRNVDWEKGILNFAVLHTGALDPEGSKIEVSVRLQYADDPLHSIYLKSFKALDVAHGLFPDSEVAILEYRVPQYGYTLNVPFDIRGFRSKEQKVMDEIIASLSKPDLATWKSVGKDIPLPPMKEIFKTLFPDFDFENDTLTKQHEENLLESMLERYAQSLRKYDFSDDGHEKLVRYYRELLSDLF